jgi:curli production assembly/transport component CsgF
MFNLLQFKTVSFRRNSLILKPFSAKRPSSIYAGRDVKINIRLMAIMACASILSVFSTPVTAQQFSYTPINPSFGGNPLNSSHLLGTANAQNTNEAPPRTLEENVRRQVEARTSARIAGIIVARLFRDPIVDEGGNPVPGPDGLPFPVDPITVGDRIFQFAEDGAGGTILTITNPSTNEVTTIRL